MTKSMIDMPCSARTRAKDGSWIYCTAGPEGHWGSHMGDRSEEDYKRIRAKVLEAQSLTNDT
jgi:hypothetical protein